MGKNRRSSGGNGASNDNPFPSEEYEKTYNDIKSQTNLNDEEIRYVLDNVLDDNITFKRVAKKGHLLFEEKFSDKEHTGIAIDPQAIRDMLERKAGFGLDDVMEAYHKLPTFQRSSITTLVMGNTGEDFNGGFYHPMFNRVCINSKTFNTKPKLENAHPISQLMFHEFGHAMDHNIGGSEDATKSLLNLQTALLYDNEKVSAYAESYRGDYDHYFSESFADAVSFARQAKEYGNDSFVVEDPKDSNRSTPLSYSQYKKDNPQIAEFAEKVVNCNTEKEVLKVFKEFRYTG